MTWTARDIAADVVRRYDRSVIEHGPFAPEVDLSLLTPKQIDAALDSAAGMSRAWRRLGLAPHDVIACGPLEDCIHGRVSDAITHLAWRNILGRYDN